jgi:hypothetical protein
MVSAKFPQHLALPQIMTTFTNTICGIGCNGTSGTVHCTNCKAGMPIATEHEGYEGLDRKIGVVFLAVAMPCRKIILCSPQKPASRLPLNLQTGRHRSQSCNLSQFCCVQYHTVSWGVVAQIFSTHVPTSCKREFSLGTGKKLKPCYKL